jgi:hypothetical protein
MTCAFAGMATFAPAAVILFPLHDDHRVANNVVGLAVEHPRRLERDGLLREGGAGEKRENERELLRHAREVSTPCHREPRRRRRISAALLEF